MAAINAASWSRIEGAKSVTVVLARRWPPALVTLYLLAVLLPLTFRLGPLQMTSVRVLLLVIFFPLAWKLVSGRAGRLMSVDVFMVLHIVWATLALAVNNPGQVVQQAGSVGLEFIGGYLVGRTLIRNREDFVAMVRFLVLVVILILPLVVYETMTGKSLMLTLIRSLPGFGAPPDLSIGRRLGLDRVQLTFVHPIHFGLFCSVVFSLCFVGLKGTMSDGRRVLSGFIVAGSGFLALSSGAFLAIILQFGLIAWAFTFRRVRRRWWLLVGMFALAYIVVDLLSNRPPIRVFMTYATFSAHTAYWRMIIFDWGMKNVWANPVFGLGLNDWVRPSYMRSGSMDNFWLVMAVRYGIPGFLFLAAGYLIALFRIMARDFSTDPVLSNLRLAWTFTFVGLTFTLYTVHVWSNVYSFVFFMFGAGIWLIDVSPDDGNQPAHDGEGVTPGGRLRTGPVYTRFPDGIPQTRHSRGPAPGPQRHVAPRPALRRPPDTRTTTSPPDRRS